MMILLTHCFFLNPLMFFVIILGTKSTPPIKMTSLTTQVSHSSVEEQSNRQSGQVMVSIPHWDSENFLFWVGQLQDLSFYLKSRLSTKVKWNRSISDRFSTLHKSLFKKLRSKRHIWQKRMFC